MFIPTNNQISAAVNINSQNPEQQSLEQTAPSARLHLIEPAIAQPGQIQATTQALQAANDVHFLSDISEKPLTDIQRRCWDILQMNSTKVDVGGTTYTRTKPSRDFYVHQWNWDSATVPFGQLTVDPKRALAELTSLMSAQWEDGMIPQINFNPQEKAYYPGAEFWHTAHKTPTEIRTSGITQPPVIGMSTPAVAAAVLSAAGGKPLDPQVKADLKLTIEGTLKFLSFLKNTRDPEQSGLITVVHPWESGLDNAPTWDEPLQATEFALDKIPQSVKDNVIANRKDITAQGANVSQRPEQAKYFYYMNLVDQFNNLGWDQNKIVEQSYFQVKDVLFTSVFAAGCDRMANFLQSHQFLNADLDINTGQNLQKTVQQLKSWVASSQAGLAATWNDDIKGFLCQNCRTPSTQTQTGYNPIAVDTISKFMPLLAKAASTEQVKILIKNLQDPSSYGTKFPTPTTPLNATDEKGNQLFEMERYWRGPTWPITNLLLIEGLQNYVDEIPECQPVIATLKDSIISRVESVGLQEYYHPVETPTAKAIGFGNFSWTAAIYLHLTRA